MPNLRLVAEVADDLVLARGSSGTTTGEKLLQEAADKAAEHIRAGLADVPADDPWRGELKRLCRRGRIAACSDPWLH